MCQHVSGDEEILELQTAYKVVLENDFKYGPYYKTNFLENGWAESIPPKSLLFVERNLTCKGYHVFKTKQGAESYLINNFKHDSLLIITVQIRGSAIPFASNSLMHEGYAVETWRPIKSKEVKI